MVLLLGFREGAQMRPISFSLATRSSVVSTLTPAMRWGGSSTLITEILEVRSTPRSPALITSIFFFLAFCTREAMVSQGCPSPCPPSCSPFPWVPHLQNHSHWPNPSGSAHWPGHRATLGVDNSCWLGCPGEPFYCGSPPLVNHHGKAGKGWKSHPLAIITQWTFGQDDQLHSPCWLR